MRYDPTEITTATLKRKIRDPRIEDRGNNIIHYLFNLLPPRAFERAFPDYAGAPAQRDKSILIPLIAGDIAADLGLPELGACFWPVKQRTVVAMPEAPIDEQYSVMAWQHQIWLAGQLLVMQPKSEAPGVEPAPDQQLRFRVTAPYSSHVLASGFAVVDVNQPGAPLVDCPAQPLLQYVAS